jgi:hypothetical protein
MQFRPLFQMKYFENRKSEHLLEIQR